MVMDSIFWSSDEQLSTEDEINSKSQMCTSQSSMLHEPTNLIAFYNPKKNVSQEDKKVAETIRELVLEKFVQSNANGKQNSCDDAESSDQADDVQCSQPTAWTNGNMHCRYSLIENIAIRQSDDDTLSVNRELRQRYNISEDLYPSTSSVRTNEITDLITSQSTLASNQPRKLPKMDEDFTCNIVGSYESISAINGDTSFKYKYYAEDNKDMYPSTSSVHTNEITDLISSQSLNTSRTIKPTKTDDESASNTSDSCESLHSSEEDTHYDYKLYVEENKVKQLSNFLKFAKQNHKFVGSMTHFEAERLLLLSKMKRDAFYHCLTAPEEVNTDTRADFKINNLKYIVNSSDVLPCDLGTWYTIIISHKCNIYSTRIAPTNRLGWIDFGGPYMFKNVDKRFKIKIELFEMKINRPSGTLRNLISYNSHVPKLKLTGVLYITINNMSNQTFTIQNTNSEYCKVRRAYISIDLNIRWPRTLQGYLIFGVEQNNGPTFWNRQWLVLKGQELSFYNYPSEVDHVNPKNKILLSDFTSFNEVSYAYPMKKAISFTLRNDNSKRIFYVVADTTEELAQWKSSISLILQNVKDWKGLISNL